MNIKFNVGPKLLMMLLGLKTNKKKKSKVVHIVISFLLFVWMLDILILWNAVPSYKHFIYMDRLQSQKPPMEYVYKYLEADYYYMAKYELRLSSGARVFTDENFIPFEETYMLMRDDKAAERKILDGQEQKKLWYNFRAFNLKPHSFSESLTPKGVDIVEKECRKNKLQYKDFTDGFFFLHLYQDDIKRCKVEYFEPHGANATIDTIHKYVRDDYKSVTVRYMRNDNVDSLLAPIREFSDITRLSKFGGATSYLSYNNDPHGSFMNNEGLRGKDINAFRRFWNALFLNYDLSKARYHFYIVPCSIDRTDIKISFNEGVHMSELNIEPDEKDMYSLSYCIDSSKKLSSALGGISFLAEFTESENVQNMRIIILSGILLLPLLWMLKNLWALTVQFAREKSKERNKPENTEE